MAFASGKDVMRVIEYTIRALWKSLLGLKILEPFPRMTYGEAMSKYGSDKPDRRIDMEVSRIQVIYLSCTLSESRLRESNSCYLLT